MSRTAIVCLGCRAPLAHRHHSGRVQPAPGVAVFYAPSGRDGPFLGLTCPACGRRREYLVAEPTPAGSPPTPSTV